MRTMREFVVAMDMARYEQKPQYVGEIEITYIESIHKYYAIYNGMGIRFDKVRYDKEDHCIWFCLNLPRGTIPIVRVPYFA